MLDILCFKDYEATRNCRSQIGNIERKKVNPIRKYNPYCKYPGIGGNFLKELFCHSNTNIDIAVLDLKLNDQKKNNFDFGGMTYYLSQECYFVGFPFNLKMDDNEGTMNNGFPIPFVKKGIVSLFISDSSNMRQIFLDGHNNPGFSGAPVVIHNFKDGSEHEVRIIGVVSAYLNEAKVIKTPYGDLINNENSGIVLSYAFDHVLEIIKMER